MITLRRSAALGAVVAACIFAAAGDLLAGGPMIVAPTGQPCRWNLSSPIPVHPDRGRLGRYGNAEAINRLLVPALSRWAAVPTARVRWTTGGILPRDIQSVEDLYWAIEARYSPIVFDQDGRILAQLGYSPQNVIAMGGFMTPYGETIMQGLMIISGIWVDGNPANGEMTEDEMINTIAHEIGHFLNLDHSQVNGHMFFGDTDDPSDKMFGPPPADSVELMYPLYEAGIGTKRLTRDDEAALSSLYPSDSLANFGSLSGTVRRADGYSPFQGANVVARNLDNPFYDAVAAVSGQRYLGTWGGYHSYELQGLYELRCLTPGARYVLELVNLLSVGGEESSIGPRYPQVQVPGVEEFFSGLNEASANPPDDPMQYVEIRVEAGQALEYVDFLCTREKPEGPPTSIAYGERSARIDRAGEIDLYAFEARGYEYIRITATAGGCCLNPAVEVFGPNGRFLAAAYASWTEVRLLATSPGTYLIAVSDLGMRQSGTYRLKIEKLRDAPTANPISYGQIKTGSLAELDQVDLYVLKGEAGDRLVASAGGQNWSVNPEVELLDSRGVLLDRSSQTGNRLVDLTLPASGEYLLAVRDPYGGYGGSYGLCLQRMNQPVNPVRVQFGQTHEGKISVAGEVVTYSWSGTTGDQVILRAGPAPTGSVSPIMYLYDPDGAPLHKPIDIYDWTDRITVVLPKTGEYAVVISTRFGGLGAFGFSLQRLNHPGNATEISLGLSCKVSLTKAAEIRTYTWTSEAGDALLLWLGNVASDDFYMKVELYDPDGVLVAAGEEYLPTAPIRTDLEKTGRYSVLIYRTDNGTREFNLNVQRLNNPGNATELVFGETRFASLAAAGEINTYAWTGNAGDSLAFRAVAAKASPVILKVEIYDPDGVSIGQFYYGKSAIATLLLPKTGRYAAFVSDQSGSSVGSYSIAIQRAPRPGNALSLGFEHAIQVSLSQPGKVQSYQWTGRTGDLVTIRLVLDSTQSSALRLDLFDPEGIALPGRTVPNASSTETLFWEPLAKTGQYVLVVSDTEGSGVGSYILTASCTGCLPPQAGPTSELHFPFSHSPAGEYQGFAVCNLSSSTSTLRFTAYDSNGALLAQKEKVLAAGSQVAFLPDELFGPTIAGKSGRVTVGSDAPNQKGFYLMFDADATFMDGSGSLSAGPYRSIMTESAQEPGAVAEISIHNLRNYQNSPTFDLVGSDGKILESRQIRLPALGSWSGSLGELFTSGNATTDSFISCRSCTGIDAFERLHQENSLSVLKAAFQDRAADPLYSAQVVAGGGYFSRLSLANSVFWPSQVSLTLYDEQGRPHAEAAANPITRDVPAGGKIVVDLGEAFGFGDAEYVHTGWLKIEWDYGILWGSITLGDRNRGSMTSLPLTGVGMREAVIPHVAQNSTYFTGIALLNFTKRPAVVSLDVFKSDASLAGHAALRLAPGERVSKLISELVPAIRNQAGGYVRISSDQDLMVYSIFGTNSLSVLSSIPAQQVR